MWSLSSIRKISTYLSSLCQDGDTIDDDRAPKRRRCLDDDGLPVALMTECSHEDSEEGSTEANDEGSTEDIDETSDDGITFTTELSSDKAPLCTGKWYARDASDYEAYTLQEELCAAQVRKVLLDDLHTSFQYSPSNIKILDCGCGVGRDLVAFKHLGYYCEGFDICPEFVAKARARSGQQVHLADFRSISLTKRFHGVFCLASLYHVPREHFLEALQNVRRHLEQASILLVTVPPGEQDFLHPEGLWVNNMSPEELVKFVQDAGFKVKPPSTIEIYGCAHTLLVAQKVEGRRAIVDPCIIAQPDTSCIYTKTACAYENKTRGFIDMFSKEQRAESARELFIKALKHAFPTYEPSWMKLLDAGCGSGRDLTIFADMGYCCEGFDSCCAFVREAKLQSGFQIYHGDFEHLNLPTCFHGIFCLASLYHVPRAKLTASIQNLSRHLVQGGVMLITIPAGAPYLDCQLEDGKWVNFMGANMLINHINAAGNLTLLHIDENYRIYSGRWNLVIALKT